MNFSLLIVDDEPELRDLIALYLCLEKVDIHHAADGEEALAVMAKHQIHSIITDLEMPNLDGEELVAQARKRGFQGSIMILTGSLSERIIRDLSPLGVKDFICKSRPGNFRETLKNFIQQSKNNISSIELNKKVSGF